MNYKTAIPIIALTILLIILGVSLYTINDLNVKYGVKKVTPIYHIENDHVSMDTYIIAERRADFIFPTDTLGYITNWKNKLDDPLDIHVSLIGTIGNNESFEKPEMYETILGSKSLDTTGYDFTLDKEGRHKLKLQIQIVNYTNKEILDVLETPTSTIEILSRADKLQEDSNFWTLVGIIISSSIAGTAALIVAYEIKASNDERKLTLRAWVAETDMMIDIKRIFNQKLEVIHGDEWKKLPDPQKSQFQPMLVEWYLNLKNSGQIPAFNIRGRTKVIIGRLPTLDDISDTFGNPFSIMAGDKHQFVFRTTFQEMDDMLNDQKLSYFIFEIRYNSANSTKEHRYGFIVRFGDGGYSKIHNWTDETPLTKIEDVSVKEIGKDEAKRLYQEGRLKITDPKLLQDLGISEDADNNRHD